MRTIADTFEVRPNRADGAILGTTDTCEAWYVYTLNSTSTYPVSNAAADATYGVQGGLCRRMFGTALPTFVETGTADVTVQLTLTICNSFADNSGIFFRGDAQATLDISQLAGWQARASYLMVHDRNLNGSLRERLFNYDNGDGTGPAAAAGNTFGNGDVMKVATLGNSIKVYKNGTLIVSVVDGAYASTGTQHGLVMSSDTDRVDNFSVVFEGEDPSVPALMRRHYPHPPNQIGFGAKHSTDVELTSEVIFNFPGPPSANRLSAPYVLSHPGRIAQIVLAAGTPSMTDSTFRLKIYNIVNDVPVLTICELIMCGSKAVVTELVNYPVNRGDYLQAVLTVVGTGLQDFSAQVYF